MNNEVGILNVEKNKEKTISKRKIKENNDKIKEHHKVKDKISVELETESDLILLKELIDKGTISKEKNTETINKTEINGKEDIIKAIFEKIDQIKEVKNIGEYLPVELRVTKEDYSKSLKDDIFRVATINKLETALILLADKINPNSAMGLNLFSGFLTVLDKNLIIIQENTIDIKDSLKIIEEEKQGKKIDNRTIWRKIIDFIKEMFTN